MQTITRPDRPMVDLRVSEALVPLHAPVALAPQVPLGTPEPPVRLDVLERSGHVAKRVLDVVLSVIGLIVLAPLLLILAIAVKRSSPGPVLFRQQRIGQNGREFDVLKFRSMKTGAHAELVRDPVAHRRYQENGFKLDADDPRITTAGRFLRTTSLDELPQLINVVRGEMSLVGIRPLLADEVELRSRYDQACYRALKPGMTGLWQVSGRSSVGDTDRHALDREYIESWSLAADLRVLLRTPVAVLRTADTR